MVRRELRTDGNIDRKLLEEKMEDDSDDDEFDEGRLLNLRDDDGEQSPHSIPSPSTNTPLR